MDEQKNILDFGCGLGGNYKFISKRGRYYGVDILPENIAYAEKRYQGAFKVTDAKKIDYQNGYFDEVHAYDVLEHVADLDATLREIDRVLKPDGHLFVVVPAQVSEDKLLEIRPSYFNEVGHVRIVNPKELIEKLKAFGYEPICISKTRGMEALMYTLLFHLRKNKPVMKHQTGSPEFSKWMVVFIWLFDTRLFITPLKYFFFVYWFTLPIGWFISRFFPKSIYLEFKKIL